MKRQALKYNCDLCGKESDHSGVIGLSMRDGELTYQASKIGDKHICISCWQQIETMQKRFSEAVV